MLILMPPRPRNNHSWPTEGARPVCVDYMLSAFLITWVSSSLVAANLEGRGCASNSLYSQSPGGSCSPCQDHKLQDSGWARLPGVCSSIHTAQLADEPGNMPHSTAERPWDQGQSWVLYFLNYWKAETRAFTGPQSIE